MGNTKNSDKSKTEELFKINLEYEESENELIQLNRKIKSNERLEKIEETYYSPFEYEEYELSFSEKKREIVGKKEENLEIIREYAKEASEIAQEIKKELEYVKPELYEETSGVAGSSFKRRLNMVFYLILVVFMLAALLYDKNEILFNDEIRSLFNIVENSFVEIDTIMIKENNGELINYIESISIKIMLNKKIIADFSKNRKYRDKSMDILKFIDIYEQKYLENIKQYAYNGKIEEKIKSDVYKFKIIDAIKKAREINYKAFNINIKSEYEE